MVIGAMTRHVEVNRSDRREARHPRPRGARRHDRRSRRAQPRHDRRLDLQQRSGGRLPGGAVVALNATVVTNKRKIAADDFFNGMFETALQPGEIVTAVQLPESGAGRPTRNSRTPPRAMRSSASSWRRRRPACASRSPAPAPASSARRRWKRRSPRIFTADAIKDIQIKEDGLNSDIHASAEYRAHLVNVMARRAVAACG